MLYKEVAPIIEKYLRILDATDLSRPRVVSVKPSLNRNWRGRNVWSRREPSTTLIEVDVSVIAHARSLERIMAHEIIHHVDTLRIVTARRVELESGNALAISRVLRHLERDGHGAGFKKLAAVVNAVMGEGYVTELTDQTYETDANKHPFFVLIAPHASAREAASGSGRLGYAWSIKPSYDGLVYARRYINEGGARMVRTTDERWANGVKLKKYSGFSIPQTADDQAVLRKLLNEAEPIDIRESMVGVLPGNPPNLSLVPGQRAAAAAGMARGRARGCGGVCVRGAR